MDQTNVVIERIKAGRAKVKQQMESLKLEYSQLINQKNQINERIDQIQKDYNCLNGTLQGFDYAFPDDNEKDVIEENKTEVNE